MSVIGHSSGSTVGLKGRCDADSPFSSLIASVTLEGSVMTIGLGAGVARRWMRRLQRFQDRWITLAALLLFLRVLPLRLLRRAGLVRCCEGMIGGLGSSVVLDVALIRSTIKLFHSLLPVS